MMAVSTARVQDFKNWENLRISSRMDCHGPYGGSITDSNARSRAGIDVLTLALPVGGEEHLGKTGIVVPSHAL